MNELLLTKKIYEIKYINDAADAFSSLCKVLIKETDSYYSCIFVDCVYDVEETKCEFENYIIDLMNAGRI